MKIQVIIPRRRSVSQETRTVDFILVIRERCCLKQLCHKLHGFLGKNSEV